MTDHRVKHATIVDALCAAMVDIGGVRPQGVHASRKYEYVTADQLREELQPIFARHGLSVTPASLTLLRADEGGVVISATYEITHSSGVRIVIAGIGGGSATGKSGIPLPEAYAVAQTTAWKNAVRAALCIPTGDESAIARIDAAHAGVSAADLAVQQAIDARIEQSRRWFAARELDAEMRAQVDTWIEDRDADSLSDLARSIVAADKAVKATPAPTPAVSIAADAPPESLGDRRLDELSRVDAWAPDVYARVAAIMAGLPASLTDDQRGEWVGEMIVAYKEAPADASTEDCVERMRQRARQLFRDFKTGGGAK